ncbi:MAG: alpha/beta fold hydrolase [Myxococcales bacterium]|nr:alpha/beta fold hydrolase [Myxococcales bacterium]
MALTLLGCVTGKYEAMDTLQFDQLSRPGLMGEAEIAGHKTVVYQAGLGDPVLFLHGLGEHAGYWNANLPDILAAEHQVIVPDLMGHGRSAKPPGEHYGMTAQARRLVALLDHLGVEKPVTVVGHSMGGQIALTLALAWPERVKALVLLAPAGIETFTKGEARWLKQVSTVAAFKARDEQQLREHYKKNVFGKWTKDAEHHLEERVRVKRAADFDAYLHAVVASIHGMLDEHVADRLASLQIPVTVVFGAQDGLIPNPILHGDDPESVADKARRLLPRAKVVVLPGLGHMLQVEDPAAINGLILEALAAAGAAE